MKKISILLLVISGFLSCTVIPESNRKYVGNTYEAEMGTGKVYIEFINDVDCQIRPSEDYMGMFTYPCKYGSIMRKVENKECAPNSPLCHYLDGYDYISIDSVYYSKRGEGEYITLSEYSEKDFLSRFILLNCMAFLYNPQKDEIICLSIDDFETYVALLKKYSPDSKNTIKEDVAKFRGARGRRVQ